MGAVELLINVEEAFDIEISEKEAQSLLTVGELYDFIVEKTTIARTGTCLTASAFYDVKTGLRKLGISDRFGPSTKLAEILPQNNRRSFWSQLSNTIALKLPHLVLPWWITCLNFCVTIVASALIAYYVAQLTTLPITFLFVGIFGFFFRLPRLCNH